MGALVQVHANGILDASTDQAGAAVRLATAPIRCRFMTANGSATGILMPFGAASAGVSGNSGTASQTNMPAATIVGIEIWDSAGTPLRKWWGALSANKTTVLGDTLSFAANAVQLQLP
jgi:2-methylaconitate cis-trans-isomerase PrpF